MFITISAYFLDESIIAVLDDKVQTVRRRSGEKFLPQRLKKTVNSSCQDHDLLAISVYGTSRLHIVERTMNQVKYIQVLEGRLMRQVREWFPGNDSIFQQDAERDSQFIL